MNDWTSLALMMASLRQQELLSEARRSGPGKQGRSIRSNGTARGFGALPWLTKIGLALIAAGILVDVLGGSQPHVETHLGHLVALLGMALTLAGIVIHGLSTYLNSSKGGPSHAVR